MVFHDGGNDKLIGDIGDDRMLGSPGQIRISGAEGNDNFQAGDRNDLLPAGHESNIHFDDAASDRFSLMKKYDQNIISNFDPRGGDQLLIRQKYFNSVEI